MWSHVGMAKTLCYESPSHLMAREEGNGSLSCLLEKRGKEEAFLYQGTKI